MVVRQVKHKNEEGEKGPEGEKKKSKKRWFPKREVGKNDGGRAG